VGVEKVTVIISPNRVTIVVPGGIVCHALLDHHSGAADHDGATRVFGSEGGTPAPLGYYDNYLVDNRSCIIVGRKRPRPRMSQEAVAARNMIARFGP
jgi:hypothetical protein